MRYAKTKNYLQKFKFHIDHIFKWKKERWKLILLILKTVVN